ncbi:MAG: hypothetical protein AB1414_02505 [bacterium]
MEIVEIRQIHNARPFHPFIIHLADGQKIPVEHPEFLAIAPDGHTIVFHSLRPGGFHIIDPSLVTALEIKSELEITS